MSTIYMHRGFRTTIILICMIVLVGGATVATRSFVERTRSPEQTEAPVSGSDVIESVVSNDTRTIPPIPEEAVTEQSVLELSRVVNEKFGYAYSAPIDDWQSEPYFFVNIDESPLPLKEYAEHMRDINVHDTNPNIKKTVSELIPVVINGRVAYQCTISGSYAFDDEGSGYLLSGPNVYTFFETDAGVKIIARYPTEGGDVRIRAAILQSFVIDANLIPKKVIPGAWRVIVGDGFEFSVPTNIFTSIDMPTQSTDSFVASAPRYGSMRVTILDTKFDEHAIEGLYGPIENPEELMLGNRVAYSYGEGDAGYMSKVILASLKNDRTLKINLDSFSEDVHPLMDEKLLQEAILKTFVFKE